MGFASARATGIFEDIPENDLKVKHATPSLRDY